MNIKQKLAVTGMALLFILTLGPASLIGQESLNNDLKLLKEFSSLEEMKQHIRNHTLSVEITNNLIIAEQGENKMEVQLEDSELLKDINSVYPSPNFEYFVAFRDRETATPFVYIISKTGKLIKRLEVNVYPYVNHSSNSEYVSILNMVGSSFWVINKKGETVFEYTDLKNNPELFKKYYRNIVFTNDGNGIIFISDKVAYYSIEEGKVLWQKNINPLRKIYISNSTNQVFLETTPYIDSRAIKDLVILDLESGGLVKRVEQLPYVHISSDGALYLQQDDKNYCYQMEN